MANQSFAPEQRASNLRFDFGEVALDGSNPTPVTTKLNTILGAVVTLKSSSTPGVLASVFSYTFSGKTLNIHAWKVTNSSTTTLVADTGTDTVGYIVFGY